VNANDVLWHGLNFVAPMFVVGALMALAAKILWRRALRATPIGRLAGFAITGAFVGYACSVAWLGRDGAISTYAVMLVSTALTVAWVSMRSGFD
jgi:hypothetical protein